MPTVNIFLPPLLGGFLLVIFFYPLRYWIQQQEGYRLIFAVSLAGGFLLFIAQLLLFFFGDMTFAKPVLAWWQSFLPVRNSALGVLAFLLSFVFCGLFQLGRLIPAFTPNAIRRRYIDASGDAFEQLLFTALKTQDAVSVTLSTNKVYVGRVNTSFNPVRGVESIRLTLEKSGYRDAITHELNLNIDYDQTHEKINKRLDEAYDRIIAGVLEALPDDATQQQIMKSVYERSESDAEIERLAHTFEVVIMASEIVSVAPFDPELYRTFFKPKA